MVLAEGCLLTLTTELAEVFTEAYLYNYLTERRAAASFYPGGGEAQRSSYSNPPFSQLCISW